VPFTTGIEPDRMPRGCSGVHHVEVERDHDVGRWATLLTTHAAQAGLGLDARPAR
jgi:hypothetical protein